MSKIFYHTLKYVYSLYSEKKIWEFFDLRADKHFEMVPLLSNAGDGIR